jgi:hypothetical protein
VLGELGERAGEIGSRREPILDLCVTVVVREVELKAEPLPGASRSPVASKGLVEHVAGDAEEPGKSRPFAAVAEAAAREPRLSERLGGQVRGGSGHSPPKPVVHRRNVPGVQLGEGGGIAARVRQELHVGAFEAHTSL